MGQSNTIYHWAKNACKQIKYLPDRQAMEHELTDHYEDHRAALIEVGYTALEAQERALDALGDPDEVGEQLAEVFNTRWNRLWQFSRVVFRVVLILFILSTFVIGPIRRQRAEYIDLDYRSDFVQMYFERTIYDDVNKGFAERKSKWEYQFSNWTAGESAAVDSYNGFTWSIEHWAKLQERLDTGSYYNSEEPEKKAVVLLKLTDHTLYPGEPRLPYSDFHAVDDQGNRYDTMGNGKRVDSKHYMSVYYEGRMLHQYYLRLDLRRVEPETQWLELRAGEGADSLCLHIDLTGGEVLG